MPEATTTRTPARIVFAFLFILAAAGVAITNILLTHNLDPSLVGKALNLPNRVFEVVIWVLVAGLALYRNRVARILILVATLMSASVFFATRPFPMNTSSEALFTTIDFVLRLFAVMLLFSRRADVWYARVKETTPKPPLPGRTFLALMTSLVVVTAMSFALAMDLATIGLDQVTVGLMLWGVAIAVAIVYMMVPRVSWGVRLMGLLIALVAPVISRLLHPVMAPLADRLLG